MIVAGMHTNEIFIENGRFHGQLIARIHRGTYLDLVGLPFVLGTKLHNGGICYTFRTGTKLHNGGLCKPPQIWRNSGPVHESNG